MGRVGWWGGGGGGGIYRVCVRGREGGRGLLGRGAEGGGDSRDAAADIFPIYICHRQLLELRE